MSNTCYKLLTLFLFLCFSQVPTNFTFNFRNFSYATITKMSSLKRNKKITRRKFVEHKLEEAFSDSLGGYVHLGRFILLIVPISQQLPRLTSLYFLSSLNDRSNLTALFLDNSQVALNNQPILKVGSFSLASNKLQSNLHAPFTLVIYPLTFVAYTGCPDSTNLTGENT